MGKNEYKKACSQEMMEKGAIKKIHLSGEIKDKRLRQKGPEPGQSGQEDLDRKEMVCAELRMSN